jgi:hypothetical protein
MKRIMFGRSVTTALTAATATDAWAGWGCGARGNGSVWSDSWAVSSEAEARAEALKNCTDSSCRITACKDHIDTMDQADKLWRPARTTVTKCTGDAVTATGCK